MRIEILYFEGCPGLPEALKAVEAAVSETGVGAEVAPVEAELGSHPGYPGSPTILLDGEDLFPGRDIDARADSCRVYATPEGLKNHPTAAMVHAILQERVAARDQAEAS